METEKGQRIKELAELFLNKDIRVYIKDIDDNIYFADLLFVGEDQIRFICYGPPQRIGEKVSLYWPQVVKLDEVKE